MSRWSIIWLAVGMLAAPFLAVTCSVARRSALRPRQERTGHHTPVLPMPLALRRHVPSGPLKVHSKNGRYLTDDDRRALLLTGSHTWSNFQDNGGSDPPPRFNYTAFLDFATAHNHNAFRLWMWEQSRWTLETSDENYWFYPGPQFERTGPGNALDGKPRFDLARFSRTYFDRLRQRVEEAQQRGMFVVVMLFNGWSVAKAKGKQSQNNPWRGHPFHRMNNINGLDGDPNRDESGEETHELAIAAVTSVQESYVRKVVDTVNAFDNVLFEISNESGRNSHAWQRHFVGFIKNYEASKPKQHLVGMSVAYPDGDNSALLASPADWIAPKEYPDGSLIDKGKVVVDDTDHWFGRGGDRSWVWKRFMSGANVLFMDGYDGAAYGLGAAGFDPTQSRWIELRRNLGYVQAFAHRVELESMVPRGELVSSGFCLARSQSGKAQLLAYIPQGNVVIVDLSEFRGALSVEWFEPASGMSVSDSGCKGGAKRLFHSPFQWESVLFLDQD
jgi:hypothetical protein